MTTVAIVQARMGSTRFPGKVMAQVCGVPLIGLLLMRLSKARRIDQIVLATSTHPEDSPLADYVHGLGYEVYRGSESDVLERYYEAARARRADTVVRITGDCPLVDPQLIDAVVLRLEENGAAYATNTLPPTFPDGLDVEAFTFAALEYAWSNTASRDREHVTPLMREKLEKVALLNDEDLSARRWTVDEPEDLEVVRKIFEHFDPRRDFSWQAVLQLEKEHPDYFQPNRHLMRNEGSIVGSGQKLWKRARRVIPGGTMLLSKRPEMFLPQGWPAYFSKAKGCEVWDLDGKRYTDLSLMAIGTNLLGYGHPAVDEAVLSTVKAGNMSTLNCPEEVFLAERLVDLHPWAEMVRFARSGGEINAIAIRIARAATGRDQVAVCGYHGWHDWYIAANLDSEEALAEHLLPGLDPAGVPRALRGTVKTFRYNQLDQLEALLSNHADIGTIMMEVSRSEEPAPGFLEGVRRLASERDCVLIFDECTSGFRETFGGLHKKYGVEPDMATFGKALGNGYAIAAAIGRRAVMDAAQRTFISSTFWTERIGPSAALATLRVMEQIESWNIVTAIGRRIGQRWQEFAETYGLTIRLSGLPALASFRVDSPSALAYKTLITQEMLGKGYLAGTSVYCSVAHSDEVLEGYFAAIEPLFRVISACEAGREDVGSLLRGPICHSGFARLN